MSASTLKHRTRCYMLTTVVGAYVPITSGARFKKMGRRRSSAVLRGVEQARMAKSRPTAPTGIQEALIGLRLLSDRSVISTWNHGQIVTCFKALVLTCADPLDTCAGSSPRLVNELAVSQASSVVRNLRLVASRMSSDASRRSKLVGVVEHRREAAVFVSNK